MQNQFYELFDLRKDQEQPHIIDQSIRGGVKVVGTNLWVLIFAILVASVGLNVNSTAVIIGAMLISPLMGPIVGIGYGAGINDYELIKLSLKNLATFTFISILASTLYFTISPLNTATPELLARTAPNLWDVLIAFFGGSAGIIALTRKSISNVVPGVAIATALMPPLCTAGYGIAQGNWEYFGGAFFLYCINSVFIALSTLIFVEIFKLPKHKNLDETTAKRTNMIIVITAFLMIVPSAYLAYNLVKQRSFMTTANQVVDSAAADPNIILLNREVDGLKRQVILTVAGENPPKDLAVTLESQLAKRGLAETDVIVRYSGSGAVDMTSLKSELRQDLYNNLQEQVNQLSEENSQLVAQIQQQDSIQAEKKRLFGEVRAQYPSIGDIYVTSGLHSKVKDKSESEPVTLISLTVNNTLSDDDKKRIEDWLSVRFKDTKIKVMFLAKQTTSNTATVVNS